MQIKWSKVLQILNLILDLAFDQHHASPPVFMTATAFQSIDGIKCDKILFREKMLILHDVYLLLFEGHLRKNCGIFYATVFISRKPWHF